MGSCIDQQVFELKHVLSADNIYLSTRTQASTRQIIALVTQDGDLVLHYANSEASSVLRRVPWFLEREKRITSLAFQPAGTWLLVTGWDGFLHIVPALALVDSKAASDQSWNPLDLTSFPAVTSSPPTCCMWWQSTALGHQVAFVGTETGEIMLVNLSSGQRLGSRKVNACVAALHVCHDSADSSYLLITCEDRQQWRVILEDRDGGWYWPEESGKSSTRISNREEIGSLLPAPSTRSRLQGLKQMSVEKLASIRQRLAETRSKTVTPSLTPSSNVGSRRGSSSSDGSARSSDTSLPTCGFIPQIENLTCTLNAFIWPQNLRGRQTLSALHAQSCFITMFKLEDIEQRTPYGHKLAFPCRDVLVTERFLYVTDTSAKRLSVVSSKLSECRRLDDLEHNPDSVIDTFEFEGDERILALYRVSQGGLIPVVSASGSSVTSSSHEPSLKTLPGTPISQEEWIEKEIQKLRGYPVDTCIVVTTRGVYHVVLKQCAVRRVLHHLLAGVDPDKASQLISAELLTSVFGLDLQKLLDLAGDLQLSRGNYIKAIELYKLARCRQMKWIVKLAAGGHSAQLLLALQEGTITSNSQEASPLERCQLANLAVLCQAQQLLSTQSKDIHEGFLRFLRTNQYFDEQMAVNIVGQNNLWKFLRELARIRGLLPEVLEVQTKMMLQALSSESSKLQMLLLTTHSFWECVSDVCLREAFLQRPHLVLVHTNFVASYLSQIDLTTLKRLAALYDPTDPTLRPGLRQFLRFNMSKEDGQERDLSLSIDESSHDSYLGECSEPLSPPSENVTTMENLVATFILVLLHISQMECGTDYQAGLAAGQIKAQKKSSERRLIDGVEMMSLVTCELSAGFSHAALIRNSGLFVWGQNSNGCLGVGPSMCRMRTPSPVLSFNSLRIGVLSVSCGRTHTLALTENGLYSWGSSAYGQLGLGDVGQSPYPRLVSSLLGKSIVSIAAGQYHSVALTSTGRVFSWGWGVHGQLGLGSIENRRSPCLISSLDDQVVNAIAAGHAHSLFLVNTGQVLGCGSSIFGQLGTGTTNKSNTPILVCNLPECIISIATGYFHNLALSKSNRLYTWGSSPHMLRVQAQAQKRARLLLQEQLQQQQLQQKEMEQEKSKADVVRPHTASSEVQIISLKDVNSEDNSINSNQITVSQETTRSTSACTSPKVTNNVRLNGPQEIFSDPLNVAFVFPDDNSCKAEPVSGPLNPMPDLLVEAVPKEIVDVTISSSKVATEPDNVSNVQVLETTEKADTPACLPDVDASQLHLFPTLVDTSLVDGLIAEIACGCHHSALVTEEGRVYTWGRNMDGQLGHSGRKEAPIPTLVPDLRAAQIACGAEFTLALHADGQVFGWGLNSSAQMGVMPRKEPNKALEGKMLSTSKRVIRIPISVLNRIESPQEIPGIPPCCSISVSASTNTALSSAPAANRFTELSTIEEPPYGPLTLHLALQQFYSHYNCEKLITMCLERDNMQAAGRILLLSNNVPASLEHHLNALISSWKRGRCKNGDRNGNLKATFSQPSKHSGDRESSRKCGMNCTPEQISSSSTTLTDESGETSHTGNSSENSEMHAFTVQGGNEEMSEGTDSEQTKSNPHPSSDETSSLASVSFEDQDVVAGSGSSPSKQKTDSTNTYSQNDGKVEDAPQRISFGDRNNPVKDLWLEHEVIRLIELHINLIEEDVENQQKISLLLEKIMSFWIKETLPSSVLEKLINQHWDKLSCLFAVLLFCSQSSEGAMLAQSLSTSFVTKLCSSLCDYVQNRGDCAQLNGLLTSLMAQKGMWGSSPAVPISIEQVMQLLNHDNVGGRTLHIEPLHDSLDNNNIVAFSCGHRLTWNDYHAEVVASRTEDTAVGSVLSDGEDSVFQHACPSCVAQYLHHIKL